MKILIISATEIEINPLRKELSLITNVNKYLSLYIYDKTNVDILITGISSIPTCYYLSKQISSKEYNLVINLGIAGSYAERIPIGSVINVNQETFSDLGIENKETFTTLFEEGLLKENDVPFKKGVLINNTNISLKSINELTSVNAITSNTAHGNLNSIKFLKEKYNPDIETMEGAAFFYVCLQEGVPFIEIRSISNFVEERNKQNWDIKLAINNLNETAVKIIKEINLENKI